MKINDIKCAIETPQMWEERMKVYEQKNDALIYFPLTVCKLCYWKDIVNGQSYLSITNNTILTKVLQNIFQYQEFDWWSAFLFVFLFQVCL